MTIGKIADSLIDHSNSSLCRFMHDFMLNKVLKNCNTLKKRKISRIYLNYGEYVIQSFLALLIFSFGWLRSAGKCERASQLRTSCVCSSVPVTMLPTARSAAVWTWNNMARSTLISILNKRSSLMGLDGKIY